MFCSPCSIPVYFALSNFFLHFFLLNSECWATSVLFILGRNIELHLLKQEKNELDLNFKFSFTVLIDAQMLKWTYENSIFHWSEIYGLIFLQIAFWFFYFCSVFAMHPCVIGVCGCTMSFVPIFERGYSLYIIVGMGYSSYIIVGMGWNLKYLYWAVSLLSFIAFYHKLFMLSQIIYKCIVHFAFMTSHVKCQLASQPQYIVEKRLNTDLIKITLDTV